MSEAVSGVNRVSHHVAALAPPPGEALRSLDEAHGGRARGGYHRLVEKTCLYIILNYAPPAPHRGHLVEEEIQRFNPRRATIPATYSKALRISAVDSSMSKSRYATESGGWLRNSSLIKSLIPVIFPVCLGP